MTHIRRVTSYVKLRSARVDLSPSAAPIIVRLSTEIDDRMPTKSRHPTSCIDHNACTFET